MPYLAEYMTDSMVAAALRLGFDGGRNTPPSSLPIIRNEHPVSSTIATIDAQVQTTSVGATEQAALTTEPPSTTLPAPTEPAAPVTPPAPRASSTSSLSSPPSKSQSPSPELRRSKDARLDENNFGFPSFSGFFFLSFFAQTIFPTLDLLSL